MRVTYEDGPVNTRRYGRVWIARVEAWPIGKAPVLSFGGNVTYDKAEIAANPGDLMKVGRKDHRGRGTTNEFRVVELDGSLRDISDDKARDYWLEIHPE